MAPSAPPRYNFHFHGGRAKNTPSVPLGSESITMSMELIASGVAERHRAIARRPRGRTLARAACACGVLLASASQAHAYLDPGTGGILLQVILGAIAAGAAALVGLRARIGAAVAGFKTRKDASTQTKDTSNP
jgi:hypothetical protein